MITNIYLVVAGTCPFISAISTDSRSLDADEKFVRLIFGRTDGLPDPRRMDEGFED
jgi:hypothetical protein